MFYVGKKYAYKGKTVLALVLQEDEVLIFIEKGSIKWVNAHELEDIYPSHTLSSNVFEDSFNN